MKYDENLMFLYDGSCFDVKGSDGDIYRVYIEAIDELAALEMAFSLDINGEPEYPLIYDALAYKNPGLINNCSYVLQLTIRNSKNQYEPVGLAIISEDWWIKNSFHINELSIRQDVQNLGLGTVLMEYIQEAAYIASKDAITLQCYIDDFEDPELSEARENFYLKLGFKKEYDKLRQLMVYPITDNLQYRQLKAKA